MKTVLSEKGVLRRVRDEMADNLVRNFNYKYVPKKLFKEANQPSKNIENQNKTSEVKKKKLIKKVV